jgi:hypothetical protein
LPKNRLVRAKITGLFVLNPLAKIDTSYRSTVFFTKTNPMLNRQLFICLISFVLTQYGHAQKWKLADFTMPIQQITAGSNQIWVNSGYTTVRPSLYAVCGVKDFVSPPFLTNGFSLDLTFIANGKVLIDNGQWGGQTDNLLYHEGVWQPDQIKRRGGYHRLRDGLLTSFTVESELIPLNEQPGFILKIEVHNRSYQALKLRLKSVVGVGNIGKAPLDKWGFTAPSIKTNTLKIDNTTWESEDARLKYYPQNPIDSIIQSKEKAIYYQAFVLKEKGDSNDLNFDFETSAKKTESAWKHRIASYLSAIPRLSSNIEGLEDYYKRALISGLVCVWENPNFVIHPYIATSGMDGGGMNTYLWDAGYCANMLALVFGSQAQTLTNQLAKIKLDEFYSYTPAGTGIGVSYSYSTWAFMNLVWSLARHGLLTRDLFEEAKRLISLQEARPKWNNLIDFGNQHNLLEMRNTGYEHYVVSPNAERAWNLRRLADLNDLLKGNATESNLWRSQADTIIEAIQKNLWNPEKQWFDCVLADKTTHQTVFSIQIFDALKAGACTPSMEEAVCAKLIDDKFLFPYGLSSVSKEDSLRYEYNDTDWGGSGAYTGDGPQLAHTLYLANKPKLAWNVLKRELWLGKHYAYYPQEHYADKPSNPTHKRSNIVSGLNGAEAILYGMLGIDPQPNGSFWINPQVPTNAEIKLNGLKINEKSININIANQKALIELEGKKIYQGKIKRVKIF